MDPAETSTRPACGSAHDCHRGKATRFVDRVADDPMPTEMVDLVRRISARCRIANSYLYHFSVPPVGPPVRLLSWNTSYGIPRFIIHLRC
jgi:hypothetical protein